jgi:hypothetical protein
MSLLPVARRLSTPIHQRRARLRLEHLEDRTLLSGLGSIHPSHVLKHPAGVVAPLSTPGPTGYSPSQLRQAYGINQISFGGVPGDGRGTTIAIVDAFDNPNLVSSSDLANFPNSDLHQFDLQFGLPDPVFTKVNQTGGSTYPAADSGWGSEITLDVQWAHAIAPGARILLVEANDNSSANLFSAVTFAARQAGVVAVSMSWGGGEDYTETFYDGTFVTPSGHSGVTFVASSGDSGAPPIYPAISPNVLSIGGTHLNLDGQGNYQSEYGWSGSGGGISAVEHAPTYQSGLVVHSGTTIINQNGKRTNPDVAYDADPYSGVPVYDSFSNGTADPWSQYGGTSISAPQWSALIAIADQGRAAAGKSSLDGRTQTLPMIYQLSADFRDITSGYSYGSPLYSAGPGYDLVTGLGTPIANKVVADLVGTAVGTATTTTVSSSVSAPVFGQSVMFTATVTPQSGGGTPTGTVQFKIDGSNFGNPVPLSGGVAISNPTSSLSVTGHTITASYGGTSTFAPSSSSLGLTVKPANTTTTVASTSNPSASGQTVTFTASVSVQGPGAGTPAGTVTFLDGPTTIGSGTLSGSAASFSTSSLGVGSHTITASYGGNSNFAGSTGNLTQTVNPPNGATPTTTAVVSSDNGPVFGESITFTATVSSSGTPTGTVTFVDTTTGTTIGSPTLSGSTASVSTSSLGVGGHTITATYSGDSTFKGSFGNLTLTVSMASTSTTVTSTSNPSMSGQTVTFTASISIQGLGAGTPHGTVTFFDTTTNTTIGSPMLSGSTASLSTSSLGVGSHAITATYNGDGNFAGSAGSLTQTVNPVTATLEDFESGLVRYHSTTYYPVGFYPYARTAPIAAHDKMYGLDMPNGVGWIYRNDPGLQVQQGQTLAVWVQFATLASGRAYFGFGASTTGTLSVVLAADTNQLIIQDNSGYSFSVPNLAATPQSYQANHWYQLRVSWASGGGITGKLYDSNGTTLLSSVQTTDSRITTGGIAFVSSSSSYDKYFDTVTMMNTSSPNLVRPRGPAVNPSTDSLFAFLNPPASSSLSFSTPVALSSPAPLTPVIQEVDAGLAGRRDDDAEVVRSAAHQAADQEWLVTDAYFASMSVLG